MISLLVLAAIVWACVLTYKRRSSIGTGQSSDRALTKGEKLQVWIICFLNPIWGGAIFYYGWKKLLPTMAKQANHISMIAFLIEVILFIGWIFLLAPQV